ncbi:MAG: hypothetical protein PHU25_12940 [Deltaproteobacteria bacterium]|nr:hypothetical protein [Deltaproteobacteria bacterium]
MRAWLFLAASCAYAAGLALGVRVWPVSTASFVVWACGGMLLAALAARSAPILFEGGVPVVAWLLLGGASYPHQAISELPLAAMVLAVAAFETRSRVASALLLPLAAAWLVAASGAQVFDPGWYGWATLAAAAVQLALVSRDGSRAPWGPPKIVDLVVCSYSGNTAHCARAFGEGMKRAGADVRLHRFHYYPDFDEPLDGDALALAFPVVGWKPPWTMVAWMLWRMPRGRGRPAFILYTCAGGPENTSLAAWLLLILRGWRPVGRAWSIYPINVVTFRLGPRALWRFLDRLFPIGYDLRATEDFGSRFARGLPSGQPHLVWALPLFLIGFLVDNKLVNTYPYRNRAWRRRCDACGICVRYCPVGRLTIRDGFPRAKGTCTLCFGCVNLCPKRSMQLVAWTEYGNAYKPRFPDLVVKRRERSDLSDRSDPSDVLPISLPNPSCPILRP